MDELNMCEQSGIVILSIRNDLGFNEVQTCASYLLIKYFY